METLEVTPLHPSNPGPVPSRWPTSRRTWWSTAARYVAREAFAVAAGILAALAVVGLAVAAIDAGLPWRIAAAGFVAIGIPVSLVVQQKLCVDQEVA
ncbi:MAG: hypothetical protein GY882_10555 [Actinomycetia bacterium]|nr:hypothetical protein [Actinomycetes bacterium]MCP4845376.1 hypothetical protein [Actinomycetes bacterium]